MVMRKLLTSSGIEILILMEEPKIEVFREEKKPEDKFVGTFPLLDVLCRDAGFGIFTYTNALFVCFEEGRRQSWGY